MSIQDAILNATQSVLAELLAPDLADKLAQDILTRAQPELESALRELAGFDLGKPVAKAKVTPLARKESAAAKKPPRKRRDESSDSTDLDTDDAPVALDA
jgi:hypothetical protein